MQLADEPSGYVKVIVMPGAFARGEARQDAQEQGAEGVTLHGEPPVLSGGGGGKVSSGLRLDTGTCIPGGESAFGVVTLAAHTPRLCSRHAKRYRLSLGGNY